MASKLHGLSHGLIIFGVISRLNIAWKTKALQESAQPLLTLPDWIARCSVNALTQSLCKFEKGYMALPRRRALEEQL